MHAVPIWMMVLAFALVLGPLVVFHELGHYLVGRWCGVRADAFSVGFGKEIVGRTDRHGTRWKLSAIPLGGYVQFAGDANAASMPDSSLAGRSADELKGTLTGAKLWQRSLIVAAGPLTNLFLALVIFFSFNVIYGKVVASPVIAAFEQGSPAEAAGLKVGDRIVAIDGKPITGFEQIRENVLPFPGRELTFSARRGDQDVSVKVRIAERLDRDEFGNEAHVGRIGVAAGKAQIVPVSVPEAARIAVGQSFGIVRLMVTGIGQIFTGERSVKELGGPLKIAKYSGEQLSLGWPQFVWFAALISINLAFINLLPIPGLDGGHLAFYAAEAVRRRPVSIRGQEWAFRTGLALVLALMLFVTINDLVSFNLFGR